eukprot:Rmarinus@m.9130
MPLPNDDDISPFLPEFIRAHLECAICLNVGTEWMVLPCQHSFCLECTTSLGSNHLCPKCRKEFTPEEVQPFLEKNDLAAQLPVFCDDIGRENGCSWEGTYESRAGHIKECAYQPVSCGLCGAAEVQRLLAYHQNEVCPEAIVSCSNEATKEVINMVPSGVHKDNVRAEVLSFAAMCNWEGARGTL